MRCSTWISGCPGSFPISVPVQAISGLNLNGVSATQVGGPFAFSTSGRSGAFAWQAIAGASFPIPNMPGLSVTADYRFMDILGGEKFDGIATVGGVAEPSGIKMHNQFDHSLVVGVRYAFNTPAPPPPAPAPTAAPAPRQHGRIWCSSTGTKPR